MDERRKVILLIGALPPPAIGPYMAMARLLESRVLEGSFRVTFLDISDRRNIQSMGRLDFVNVWLGVKHALEFLVRLVVVRPEIVYLGVSQGLWGYLRDLTFIVPALLSRRKLVLHLRGSEFRKFYDEMPGWLRSITRWVLSRTARMLVLGECIRPVFQGLMPSERVFVVPNGIDYKKFPQAAAGPGRNPKHILYLSHLSRRKGLLLLLEALPEVFRKHPDASVTIAGLWQSGNEKDEAQRIVRLHGMEENVRFVGEVTGPAKIKLFEEHGLFVFTPLEPEGLPWVILEAMSGSLPVITTNQGAITEVVVNGETGLIIQPDKETLSDAICALLNDPQAAEAMGQAGRLRVEHHFSEQKYLERLTSLFNELAGGKVSESIRPPTMVSERALGQVSRQE